MGIENSQKLVQPVVEKVNKRFGGAEYTAEEKVSLEESIVNLMKEKKLTLGVAESCSGGMLSARIINVPGVSDVYKAGFVTYANEAKHKLIGVSNATLEQFGAVSEETAREMVQGTLRAAESDYAVAITGIAGPDGGTDKKPVGLVYIACGNKDRITVKECKFNGNRDKVRQSSVAYALRLLREEVMKPE